MFHFVRQLQAYCQLEVIACRWQQLLDFMSKKEGDLDALINAHKAYLSLCVRKVLLLHPTKKEKEVCHRAVHQFEVNSQNIQEYVLVQVRDALNMILQFRDAMVSRTIIMSWELLTIELG